MRLRPFILCCDFDEIKWLILHNEEKDSEKQCYNWLLNMLLI